MTPQEKAINLVESFMLWKFQKCELSKKQAKQSALIAVDELIYETQFEVPNIRQRYWIEVKQEIENL
jgi:hypothetical protein